jgi:hypothetical protein
MVTNPFQAFTDGWSGFTLAGTRYVGGALILDRSWTGGPSERIGSDALEFGTLTAAYSAHFIAPPEQKRKARRNQRIRRPADDLPSRGPQNPVVTIPLTSSQLKGLIQDRLNYGDCADYVKRLTNQAAKMAAANNPPNDFKDIPDLFDQIVAQPKGGFKFEPATGTTIGTGSGSAGGYLVRGDATITVSPFRYYANSHSYVIRSAIENAPYRYGITGLHEVIHHAGRYWYGDDFLTRVARSLEPDANISYWDHALQNHCLPANRRYNYDYTK